MKGTVGALRECVCRGDGRGLSSSLGVVGGASVAAAVCARRRRVLRGSDVPWVGGQAVEAVGGTVES